MTEAIQIGARAIKENSTSVDEVQRCLEELDSSIAMQEVDNVLGIALMRMTYHKTYINTHTHGQKPYPVLYSFTSDNEVVNWESIIICGAVNIYDHDLFSF